MYDNYRGGSDNYYKLTVVIGIGHPFEFTEESTAEKLSLRLGLLNLEGVLYALFVEFDNLVGCELAR